MYAYSYSGNRIRWDSVTGATTYNLYRATTSGAEVLKYSGITSHDTQSFLYVDSSVSNGTKYYYQVTAVNAGGESPRSAEVSVKAGSSMLSAPTLAAQPDSGQATLHWSAVTGAASYSVFRSVGPGSALSLYQTGVTGTAWTDTGLTNGTSYNYYVDAVSPDGYSYDSNIVTIRYGFAVSVSPTPVVITRGTVGVVSVTVMPWSNYTGPVVLSGIGLPSGVSACFYPSDSAQATVMLSGVTLPEYTAGIQSQGVGGSVTSNLYVAVPSTAEPGTYTLNVTGTSTGPDGFTSTTALTLTIN